MLTNYVTIAVRNLLKHKEYSTITVAGLAVGMASVILIALHVHHELTYDRQHQHADRIYRVVRETKTGDSGRFFSELTSGALVPAVLSDIPEVESATRLIRGIMWVRHGERAFEQLTCVGDAAILDLFTLPLVRGTAAPDPSTVLITRSMAQRFFGDDDPIGELISIEHPYLWGDYVVQGVPEDFPPNSAFRFDLLTFQTDPPSRYSPWDQWTPTGWLATESFVLLTNKHPVALLEQKLSQLIARYMGDEIAATNSYHLQALTRIHLYSKASRGC